MLLSPQGRLSAEMQESADTDMCISLAHFDRKVSGLQAHCQYITMLVQTGSQAMDRTEQRFDLVILPEDYSGYCMGLIQYVSIMGSKAPWYIFLVMPE